MSKNQCAGCGQWAGRGHKCPTPIPATVPVNMHDLTRHHQKVYALRDEVAARVAAAKRATTDPVAAVERFEKQHGPGTRWAIDSNVNGDYNVFTPDGRILLAASSEDPEHHYDEVWDGNPNNYAPIGKPVHWETQEHQREMVLVLEPMPDNPTVQAAQALPGYDEEFGIHVGPDGTVTRVIIDRDPGEWDYYAPSDIVARGNGWVAITNHDHPNDPTGGNWAHGSLREAYYNNDLHAQLDRKASQPVNDSETVLVDLAILKDGRTALRVLEQWESETESAELEPPERDHWDD